VLVLRINRNITMHLKEVEMEEVLRTPLERGNELSLPVSRYAGTLLDSGSASFVLLHSMQLVICLCEDILMSHNYN
jgi:hypothetical protein